MKRTNKNIKQNIFMISLIIIEVTQKIRIMETIMNRIFQKFLQSVIDLSSVGAKCREDNTHDIDMNPDAEVPIPEWKVYFDGNFWEPSGKGHAGTELRLNSNSNGLGIIGLFLRCILAIKVLSWIFVCVLRQKIFANL